ncbi:MAG: hypothetical protein PHX03_00520 [Bacilli bacterium]|nr:hypothetical protein [Bacilli bacterium]
MVGGVSEKVMGAMYNEDNETIVINDSGFDSSPIDIDDSANAKYIDKYDWSNNQDYSRSKLGDATGETRKWYNDCDIFVSSKFNNTWFDRGGYHHEDIGDQVGIFYSQYYDGGSHGYHGFRVVSLGG